MIKFVKSVLIYSRKAKPVPTKIPTIPVPTTTVKYDKVDHKRRLRELLVPLPRHIAGRNNVVLEVQYLIITARTCAYISK